MGNPPQTGVVTVAVAVRRLPRGAVTEPDGTWRILSRAEASAVSQQQGWRGGGSRIKERQAEVRLGGSWSPKVTHAIGGVRVSPLAQGVKLCHKPSGQCGGLRTGTVITHQLPTPAPVSYNHSGW